MTTITVGQREVRLAGGTKVARSLKKEAQCRSDWCVFYFILFILYFFHLLLLYNILYSQQ